MKHLLLMLPPYTHHSGQVNISWTHQPQEMKVPKWTPGLKVFVYDVYLNHNEKL
jgi:hypothetical protein